MESFGHDLRHGFRMLAKRPALTAVAVLALGLGIGANTTVFSLVSGILLRPLPMEHPERLVLVEELLGDESGDVQTFSLSIPTFMDWDAENRVFEALGAATGLEVNLTGEAAPERVGAGLVSWDFFSVVGIRPAAGREFLEAEDRPGGDPVVLLSDDLWRRRFGSDPAVLGKTLSVDGTACAIVGVMPPGLRYPQDAEMWMPLRLEPDPQRLGGYFLHAVGRLRPGLSIDDAKKEMAGLASRLAGEQPPANASKGAELRLLRDSLLGELRGFLYALLAAALFVLLIACANVSNLLLARSLEQTREVAIRAALGASRGRLVRQFLVQSVLLAVFGCMLGAVLTVCSIPTLVSLSPLSRQAVRQFDVGPRMDLATLGFGMMLALLTGVLFGLAPALRAARGNLHGVLKQEGRSVSLSSGSRRVLGALVIAEIAISVVLLVGAALLIRSFQSVSGVDRGFDPRNVLAVQVAFPEARYPEIPEKARFIEAAMERIRALPGVTEVGAASILPLFPGTLGLAFNVEGQPAPSPGYRLAHGRSVTPDYFTTIRTPLITGRFFGDQDTGQSEPVVLVSQSLAERYWPHEDPIGKRLKRGMYESQRPWLTVVGVVGTLRETWDDDLDVPDAIYMPYTQVTAFNFPSISFAVKSAVDPHSLVRAATAAVHEVDPELAVQDVATMEELLARSLTQDRFGALLVGVFGALGLILATLGVYGVLSYTIGQRTQEIGIRMALGAGSRDIFSLVVRHGFVLTALGVIVGLAGAYALNGAVKGLLFEQVSPTDPISFAAAPLLLVAVAFMACVVPARRAMRVDPLIALRRE